MEKQCSMLDVYNLFHCPWLLFHHLNYPFIQKVLPIIRLRQINFVVLLRPDNQQSA